MEERKGKRGEERREECEGRRGKKERGRRKGKGRGKGKERTKNNLLKRRNRKISISNENTKYKLLWTGYRNVWSSRVAETKLQSHTAHCQVT